MLRRQAEFDNFRKRSERERSEYLQYASMEAVRDLLPVLDDFDRALLRIVQLDNRTPLRVLAERVHLSTAAVQRRLRRLEERGVIRANVAEVDPAPVIGLTVSGCHTYVADGVLVHNAKMF